MTALIRYDAARRALAAAHRVDEVKAISSEHRAIRRKARTLHLHANHASSVQTVQNKVKTIRKGLRRTSSSTIALKEQALAEIKAAWQRIEKYNLEFGKVCYEWRNKFKAQGFRKEGDGVLVQSWTNWESRNPVLITG